LFCKITENFYTCIAMVSPFGRVFCVVGMK
jgi:hypothetical protein